MRTAGRLASSHLFFTPVPAEPGVLECLLQKSGSGFKYGRTTYTQAHPSGGKGRPVQILKLAEKAGHREAVLSSQRRGWTGYAGH